MTFAARVLRLLPCVGVSTEEARSANHSSNDEAFPIAPRRTSATAGDRSPSRRQATLPTAAPSCPLSDAASEQVSSLLASRKAGAVLIESLLAERVGHGRSANVHRVPWHDAIVLRVGRLDRDACVKAVAANEMPFRSVTWPDAIQRDNRLGIALAMAVPSTPAGNAGSGGEVTYRDLAGVQGTPALWLLRKVDGRQPADGYARTLGPMDDVRSHVSCGVAAELSNYYRNQRDEATGLRAARYLLDRLKSGESFQVTDAEAAEHGFRNPAGVTIKMDEYGPLSERPSHRRRRRRSNPGLEFYAAYQSFAQAYVRRIEAIAQMPQRSFDNAVSLIAQMNDSHRIQLDFDHQGNTLVDAERGEFRFVDVFPPSPWLKGKSSAELTEAFGACLFGKGLVREWGGPHRMIHQEPDLARFNQSRDAILVKLDQAWPGLRAALESGYLQYER